MGMQCALLGGFIMFILKYLTVFVLFYADEVAPQQPEINHQFAKANDNGTEISDTPGPHVNTNLTNITNENATTTYDHEIVEPNFIVKLYTAVEHSIKTFVSSKKVAFVLHNIGTCVVNGVMEIITYYLPAPMIPLLASAAGMVIPFEPVVTLRERMPVTSYRRAINSAVNSFMGTFDKYKMDDTEDPYMTRRFNRRFMNDPSSREKKRDES